MLLSNKHWSSKPLSGGKQHGQMKRPGEKCAKSARNLLKIHKGLCKAESSEKASLKKFLHSRKDQVLTRQNDPVDEGCMFSGDRNPRKGRGLIFDNEIARILDSG